MTSATDARVVWLNSRRTGIGGSEVAAILGEHPFLGAWDVWLSKVEGYERPPSPLMEQGRFMEPGVADWFSQRHGLELITAPHLVHPSRPRLMCTPDRFVNHPDGNTRLLSIKVPGPWFDSEEWGERHHWRVPTYAYLQLQHEMFIAGPRGLGLVRDDWAQLAAPLGGDLVVMPVQGDQIVQDKLAAAVEEWWRMYVTPRNCGDRACCADPEATSVHPPPLDGTDGAKMWLRRRFPKSPNPIRDATPAEDVLALELKAAEKNLEAAEHAYGLVRQRVEQAIGASEGLRGPFGRISFKANVKGVRSMLTTWTGGPKP